MSDQVMERAVFHAGKTFVLEGETRSDAYVIQEGEVLAYVTDKNQKIEVEHYGPGTIIAEFNLVYDEQSSVSYEALTNTTVIKIARQDFEKKMKKLDAMVFSFIMNLVEKLKEQERKIVQNALETKRVDMKALEIVEYLLRDMSGDRRNKYEDILLPHFNVMVKALEDLKTGERKERQKKDLDAKVEELKEE